MRFRGRGEVDESKIGSHFGERWLYALWLGWIGQVWNPLRFESLGTRLLQKRLRRQLVDEESSITRGALTAAIQSPASAPLVRSTHCNHRRMRSYLTGPQLSAVFSLTLSPTLAARQERKPPNVTRRRPSTGLTATVAMRRPKKKHPLLIHPSKTPPPGQPTPLSDGLALHYPSTQPGLDAPSF